MEGYRPGTYGDAFADVYDDWYGDGEGAADPTSAVDFLAGLAGLTDPSVGPVGLAGLTDDSTGDSASEPAADSVVFQPNLRPVRMLELGVGSGRLALPLAKRGLDVWGLDASAAMIARLQSKARDGRDGTGSGVRAVVGDMSAPPFASHSFGLAFVAVNTLFNLPDADLQARCLHELARCVVAGGLLVIEAFVPNDEPDQPVSVVEAPKIELGRVVLTASRREPAEQVVFGQHIEITEAGVRLRPWKIRYCSPAQLDTMAGAAGWRLDQRWASWTREPFDDASPSHISVYRLEAGAPLSEA